MTRYQEKKVEQEFNKFAQMNFDKPQKCRSIGQIRYYMQELTDKINEFKASFKFVPVAAYTLLSQYNAAQNKLIHKNFQEVYL